MLYNSALKGYLFYWLHIKGTITVIQIISVKE